MNFARSLSLSFVIASVVSTINLPDASAGIVYDTIDAVYSQDFNTLSNVTSTSVLSSAFPAWTNDSTLPGWSLFRGTNAATGIGVGNGANNATGGFISVFNSFGSTGSTERALGSASGGGSTSYMAVSFVNAVPNSLDSFTVAYDGEQWRAANVINSPQTLAFQYGFGSSFATVGSWTDVASLNFTSPIVTGPGGFGTALNGNLAANRKANITATVSGIDWETGDTLWLRWEDIINSPTHGLAIDNFQFSASSSISAVPEPSSLLLLGLGSICGVSLQRFRSRKRKVN